MYYGDRGVIPRHVNAREASSLGPTFLDGPLSLSLSNRPKRNVTIQGTLAVLVGGSVVRCYISRHKLGVSRGVALLCAKYTCG